MPPASLRTAFDGILGVDVSAFSGQTVELRVCTLYNEAYGRPGGFTVLNLDSISFVPEPGTLGLLATGLVVGALAWRRRGAKS